MQLDSLIVKCGYELHFKNLLKKNYESFILLVLGFLENFKIIYETQFTPAFINETKQRVREINPENFQNNFKILRIFQTYINMSFIIFEEF